MKAKFNIGLALTIFALTVNVNTQAQERFSLRSAKASIQGTSSLHDWESAITTMECTGYFIVDDNVLKSIKSVEMKVLVEGIKSTKGKVMDDKTYEAFHYDKHPYITFNLTDNKIAINPTEVATVEVTGNLTMAGTTRPITLTAKGKVLTNGDLQISTSKKIKMSEFKMKQPTALLGAITVADEVTVEFDLTLMHAVEQVKKQ